MRISDWSSDVCSSDLGARPLACLMNYALQGDAAWDTAFLAGLAEALQTHGMPLIGGDTVSLPKGAPGVFTLTAIGEAPASGAPARNGAQEGDVLFVTGTVGDAGIGLALAQRGIMAPAAAIRAYPPPTPRLAEGPERATPAPGLVDVKGGVMLV